jgi:uncharacterized membrane protein YvbJ
MSNAVVELYSPKQNEISSFLEKFYNKAVVSKDILTWKKDFENPVEIVDLLSSYIDNNDKFTINMWVKLDPDFLIYINEHNANHIIKYLFERYPY